MEVEKNLQTTISIGLAGETDLPEILNLLTENSLPPEGVGSHLATALVARANGAVIGSAVLELYGQAALLRSVAVAPAYQGQGLGQRLTHAALNLAQQAGISHIYLLTETAGQFFPKFGFSPIGRSQVPAAVQGSLEFTSLCPDSALVMTLELEGQGETAL